MPEGTTSVYCKSDDHSSLEYLIEHIRNLGISEIEHEDYPKDSLCGIWFEHNAQYTDYSFNKIIRGLCKIETCDFIRARHVDEYMSEIFWICDGSKYKRYEHGEDEEGPNVVKAYRHWNSGMGNLWLGSISKDSVDIMSERYGQFNESGKKIKQITEDYSHLIEAGVEFLSVNVRVPYAAAEWDSHIPVFESYALYFAKYSPVPPVDGNILYTRSYYFPNLLGYAWTWENEGNEILLLLTFPGNLGVDATLIVNKDKISHDHLFILDKKERLRGYNQMSFTYDFNQHVEIYHPFSFSDNRITPPCLDQLTLVLPDDQSSLKEKYRFDGMVTNISCYLQRCNDGRYCCAGYYPNELDLIPFINDWKFCKRLDELPRNLFKEKSTLDPDTREFQMKLVYACELQVEFDSSGNIRLVLKENP